MLNSIVKVSIFGFLVCTLSCKKQKEEVITEGKKESIKEELSYHEKYMLEIKKIQPLEKSSVEGMIRINGGEYAMGATDTQARPDEYPVHKQIVNDFYIDVHEVTNANFEAFVNATGYITTAERPIDPKHIALLTGADSSTIDPTPSGLVFTGDPQMWWKIQHGANWRHPQGPGSNIIGKENYPVVQISWYDAMAYCKWIGKRLPTEEEFEYVARNEGQKTKYTWGDNYKEGTKNANFHQGIFPNKNLKEDNFEGLAPIKSFKPNKLGIYDIAGNVWEWTLNSYSESGYQKKIDNGKPLLSEDNSVWQRKSIRGGSFLCNESYCSGYRVSARMSSSPDTGLEHLGFRCIKDI